MAELPRFSGSRERVRAQQIRVIDRSEGIGDAGILGMAISEVAQEAEKRLRQPAAEAAQRAGEAQAESTAIQYDPSGRPVPPALRDNQFAIANMKYNQMMRVKYQQELDILTDDRLMEVVNNNPLNPMGVLEAGGAYVDEMTRYLPDEYKDAYSQRSRAKLNKAYRAVEAERKVHDEKLAQRTNQISIQRNANAAFDLARGPLDEFAMEELKDRHIAHLSHLQYAVDQLWITEADRQLQIDTFETQLTWNYLQREIRNGLGDNRVEPEEQMARLKEWQATAEAPNVQIPGFDYQGGAVHDIEWQRQMRDDVYKAMELYVQSKIHRAAYDRQVMSDAIYKNMVDVLTNPQIKAEYKLNAVNTLLTETNWGKMNPKDIEAIMKSLQPASEMALREVLTTDDLVMVSRDNEVMLAGLDPDVAAYYRAQYNMIEDLGGFIDTAGQPMRAAQLNRMEELNRVLTAKDKGQSETELRMKADAFNYNARAHAAAASLSDDPNNPMTANELLDTGTPEQIEEWHQMMNSVPRSADITKETMRLNNELLVQDGSPVQDDLLAVTNGGPLASHHLPKLFATNPAGFDQTMMVIAQSNMLPKALMDLSNMARDFAYDPSRNNMDSMKALIRAASVMRKRNNDVYMKMAEGQQPIMNVFANMDSPALVNKVEFSETEQRMMQEAVTSGNRTQLDEDTAAKLREKLSRQSIMERFRNMTDPGWFTGESLVSNNVTSRMRRYAMEYAQMQQNLGEDIDLDEAVKYGMDQARSDLNAAPSFLFWAGQTQTDWMAQGMVDNHPGVIYARRAGIEEYSSYEPKMFDAWLGMQDVGALVAGQANGMKFGKDVKLAFEGIDGNGDPYYSFRQPGGGYRYIELTHEGNVGQAGHPRRSLVRYADLVDGYEEWRLAEITKSFTHGTDDYQQTMSGPRAFN